MAQENHPRKLEYPGEKLNDNATEECPECAEHGDVVQLQEVHCYAQGAEQIKNESGAAPALYLPQIQPTKPFRHRNGEQQSDHKGEAAAPSPDAGRQRPDRQQQDPDHAQYQGKDRIRQE